MSFDVILRNPGSGFNISLYTAPPSSEGSGYLKVWNGAEWVLKPLKVWSGSAWVTKPVKRWTGTVWQIAHDVPSNETIFDDFTIAAWEPDLGANSSGEIVNFLNTGNLITDPLTSNWDGEIGDGLVLSLDSVSSANLTTGADRTITFWHKRSSNYGQYQQFVSYYNSFPSNVDGWVFRFTQFSTQWDDFEVYLMRGLTASGDRDFFEDTWYFHTIILGSNKWAWYINNETLLTLLWVSESNIELPGANLQFGDWDATGRFSDIRIHNKALNETERTSLFTKGRKSYSIDNVATITNIELESVSATIEATYVAPASGRTAPTFIASTSAQGSFTINKPSGVVENDLLIGVFMDFVGSFITLPGGWTDISGDIATEDPSARVGYKIAGSSEPANYTFSSSAQDYPNAIILAYSNVDTVTPIASYSTNSGTYSVPSAPILSVTNDNSLVALFIAGYAIGDRSTPTGMTQREYVFTTSAHVEEGVDSGTYGPKSSSASENFWAAIMVAVNGAVS